MRHPWRGVAWRGVACARTRRVPSIIQPRESTYVHVPAYICTRVHDGSTCTRVHKCSSDVGASVCVYIRPSPCTSVSGSVSSPGMATWSRDLTCRRDFFRFPVRFAFPRHRYGKFSPSLTLTRMRICRRFAVNRKSLDPPPRSGDDPTKLGNVFLIGTRLITMRHFFLPRKEPKTN